MPSHSEAGGLNCAVTAHTGTIFYQAIVRCTVDGWQSTASTAINPCYAPLGCIPDTSGPAAVVGTLTNRQAQKKAPHGKRLLPSRPYKPVMPKHGDQKQGGRVVCDANPPYVDVGPSNTVGQCLTAVRAVVHRWLVFIMHRLVHHPQPGGHSRALCVLWQRHWLLFGPGLSRCATLAAHM